jgi:hypothetical protein
MTEADLAMMRNAGRPGLWLIVGIVFVLVGLGLIAMALHPMSDAWGLVVVGVLHVAFGAMNILTWRKHRVDYSEYRRIACQKCGYDRRGLAEGATCPECGATPGAVRCAGGGRG